jgi:F420-dependent oxidoreductase-like protein
MIEGQEDVTWAEWQALAQACEQHGLDGLFRSDHYASVTGHLERGSLDAWTSVAALAAVTSTLRLGTMISPASFRHPSVLAKAVVTADHVSRGRVELGIGAGWSQIEHELYGFTFHDVNTRLDVLAEQLEIIRGQWASGAFSFDGEHYKIKELDARPKPAQKPHPPIIVGGNAGPRSAALAARWADEYNTNFVGPVECRARRKVVTEAWERAGRDPNTVRFSLTAGCTVGSDKADLARRLRAVGMQNDLEGDGDAVLEQLGHAWIAGTPDWIVERLLELQDAGVDRVMLQHPVHRDLEALAILGTQVLPAVQSGR